VAFLLKTGCRKREALDARWEDFDVERRLWRIPVTKAGKPRWVPIGDGLMRLMEQLPSRR